MFSKACEYGIRATLYIAQQSLQDERVRLKAIAHEIDAPEAFTAKILQQLVKSDLLQSFRGPKGGFILNGKKEILLHDVVIAIDGDHLMEDCVLGLNECSSINPCPVHDKFSIVKNQLSETLLSTRVNDEVLLDSKHNLRN